MKFNYWLHSERIKDFRDSIQVWMKFAGWSVIVKSLLAAMVVCQQPLIAPDDRWLNVSLAAMGSTQSISLTPSSAILSNPAMICFQEPRIELSGIQVAIGLRSLNSISKTIQRRSDFRNAPVVFHETHKYLTHVQDSPDLQPHQWRAIQRLDALTLSIGRWVQHVRKWPIGGSLSSAGRIHRQWQNHSFALTVYAQAFALMSFHNGIIIDSLVAVRQSIGFQPADAQRIENILEEHYNHSTGRFSPEALPEITAATMSDIVYSASYGYRLNRWALGLNSKVIIRKTAAGLVNSERIVEPIREFRQDWNYNKHKFSLDAGLIYAIHPDKTLIGLSVQDLIGNEYDLKSRDTFSIKNRFTELPVYHNVEIAFSHRLHSNLDIHIEYSDLFSQTGFYSGLFHHIHGGMEYRLIHTPQIVLPLRAGWYNRHWTLGFGLYLFRIIYTDYALVRMHTFIPYIQHRIQIRFFYPS